VRIFKVTAGFGLLLAGIVMLAIPGPGWLTIAAGLAMLATEFAWARHALEGIKSTTTGWRRRLTREDRHGHHTREANLAQRGERAPRT
jgi:uncharacterized protein (TIGR02611 family)